MQIDIYKIVSESNSTTNPEVLKFLASYGSPITLNPGDKIVTEGDYSKTVYVFLEGEADVIKTDLIGNESIIGQLSKGTVFGEMGVFLEMRRSASVVATTEVKLLEFSNQRFFDAIFSLPELAYKFMKILSERIDSQNESLVKQNTLLDYYKVAFMIKNALYEASNDLSTISVNPHQISVMTKITELNVMSVLHHLIQERILYDDTYVSPYEYRFAVDRAALDQFMLMFLPNNI